MLSVLDFRKLEKGGDEVSNKKNKENKELKEIVKKLDIILVILFARAGLGKEEVADVLGVSGKTITRMVPFHKIKPRVGQ
ncbi:hypothetical protein ES706_01203 [subsurface metagenome]